MGISLRLYGIAYQYRQMLHHKQIHNDSHAINMLRLTFVLYVELYIIVGNFGEVFNLVIWCVVQVFSKIVMTTITVFMLIEYKLIIILNFVQFSGKGHHVLQ